MTTHLRILQVARLRLIQFTRPTLLGFLFSAIAWAGFAGPGVYAADPVPVCLAYGKPLAINNQQVLHWKRTTPNQFRERANIQGVIVEVYPDKNGHEHFAIQIGKYEEDRIEVIYNQDFGALPDRLQEGSLVQACGDYITSTAPSGPYPASPDGALVHWVHMNPSGRGHDPGFITIDGVLYGQDVEHAPPKKGGKNRDRRQRQRNLVEEGMN